MADPGRPITVGVDVVIRSVTMATDTTPARDTPARSYPTLEVMAEAMAYAEHRVWDHLPGLAQIDYLNKAGAVLSALGVPGGGLCQETMQGLNVDGEEPPVLRCVLDSRHTPPHRTGTGTSWIRNPFSKRP